jgi:beta-glucosidase
MENRTYRFFRGVPLYPFGYGLSYTDFCYSAPSVSRPTVEAGADVEVSSHVKNNGSRESDEVVQLYLKDMEASTRVPNFQLAGFRRIHLKPGESAEVKFTVTARQMALIDDEGSCILEPGRFRAYVGGSQPDQRSAELLGRKVPFVEFLVTGHPLPLRR